MHKHLCPTCHKIWDCNNTELITIYEDDDNPEDNEYIECDHIDNYEFQCQECFDSGKQTPSWEALNQQFLCAGGTIIKEDGTEINITKQ